MKKSLIFILLIVLLMVVAFFTIGRSSDALNLQPSGLNSKFNFDTKQPFENYVAYHSSIVAKVRSGDSQMVIKKNSPFIMLPPSFCNNGSKKGVLLIHGLISSPDHIHKVAEELNQKCMTVFALLLAGHGTRAGDMLDVDYRDWLKQVDYAASELSKRVDQLYIGGHSLGGALAFNYAVLNPKKIEGVMLFNAAFAVDNLAKLAFISKYFVPWVSKIPPNDSPTFYGPFAANGVAQVQSVIDSLIENLEEAPNALSQVPVFSVYSYEDATIKVKPSIDILTQHTSPELTRLLIYKQADAVLPDDLLQKPFMVVQDASVKEMAILGQSHVSTTRSQDDELYGRDKPYGLYCAHYMEKEPKKYDACLSGVGAQYAENLEENLDRYPLVARVMYNPLFDQMIEMLNDFFDF